MKKGRGILLFLLLFLAFFVLYQKFRPADVTPVSLPSENILFQPTDEAPTKTPVAGPDTSGIFVPYWAVNSLINSSYDEYYYFGIKADENGIDKTDPGYINLGVFTQKNTNAAKFLVVRMIDTGTNEKILNDNNAQQKIISQSIAIAKANGFSGIVLDLEFSALSFGDVQKQISDFDSSFYQNAHSSGFKFYVTAYGDTFYRARPFDMAAIAKNADKILILVYDFHKANGDAGPNFPLNGLSTYGYDFPTMISDFEKDIPIKKITVVFGMFGYDWPIDEKGRSANQAESLTDNQVAQKFLNNCTFKNCKIVHDSESAETKIMYTDSQNQNHVVWFEDQSSVKQKEKFLQSRGINSFSFWANSYF